MTSDPITYRGTVFDWREALLHEYAGSEQVEVYGLDLEVVRYITVFFRFPSCGTLSAELVTSLPNGK
jgi:hypothetical protein